MEKIDISRKNDDKFIIMMKKPSRNWRKKGRKKIEQNGKRMTKNVGGKNDDRKIV